MQHKGNHTGCYKLRVSQSRRGTPPCLTAISGSEDVSPSVFSSDGYDNGLIPIVLKPEPRPFLRPRYNMRGQQSRLSCILVTGRGEWKSLSPVACIPNEPGYYGPIP